MIRNDELVISLPEIIKETITENKRLAFTFKIEQN